LSTLFLGISLKIFGGLSMNTVERVKSICKERKIPISKLEKDCGFGNAYISGLRKGSIPDDRLKIISEYLNLPVEYLMTGKEPVADYLYTDENSDLLIEFTKEVKNDAAFAKRVMRYMSLLNEDKKSIDDMIDFMYYKNHNGED
jgi:transcriptional regulator with XRE-family HTH domain